MSSYSYFDLLNHEESKYEAIDTIFGMDIPEEYKLAAAVYIDDEEWIEKSLSKNPRVNRICSPLYVGQGEKTAEIFKLFMSKNDLDRCQCMHRKLFREATRRVLETRNYQKRTLPESDFSPAELALKIGNEKVILRLLKIENIFNGCQFRKSYDFSDDVYGLMKLVYLNCDNYTFAGYYEQKIRERDFSFLSSTMRFMSKKYFEGFYRDWTRNYTGIQFHTRFLKPVFSTSKEEDEFFERILTSADFSFILIMYGNMDYIEKYKHLIKKNDKFFNSLYKQYTS